MIKFNKISKLLRSGEYIVIKTSRYLELREIEENERKRQIKLSRASKETHTI